MDRRAKERLVGASMLVALIVIVVPELLSGPKPMGQPSAAPADAVRTYTVDLADKLPSPSTASSDSLGAAGGDTAASQVGSIPSAVPAAGAPAGGPATATGSPPAAPSGAAEGDSANPGKTPAGSDSAAANPYRPPLDAPRDARADTSGETPPTQVAPAAKPLRAASLPTVESPAPSPIVAVNRPSHGAAGGWTVQLGSFASEENADRLAHQLKVQGYPVYVLSSGSGAMLRHRVRMGPLADRDAALRMVAKLKGQGQPATLVPP